MKMKILSFVSLMALLLVSTAILADGRPTGIRIGRAVSGGGTNVQMDITVPAVDYYYDSFSTDVWLGNTLPNRGFAGTWNVEQYESSASSVPLPWAIDWGDSSFRDEVVLFGPSGGPFRGTFEHTYVTPGNYLVTVGDALCCSPVGVPTKAPIAPTVTTGNTIMGSDRYIWSSYASTNFTWTYGSPIILAVTANATVTTGTGIPALNIYGLLAMGLVLVGTGLLVYRKPQSSAV
jgi:hypothetical protein